MRLDRQALACPPNGLVQRFLQQLAGRQLGEVLGHANAALIKLEQLDVFFGSLS